VSKAQKIAIVITLLLMASILLFPSKKSTSSYSYYGREFIFSYGFIWIDLQRTIFELLAVALIGGTIVTLLSLKKSN